MILIVGVMWIMSHISKHYASISSWLHVGQSVTVPRATLWLTLFFQRPLKVWFRCGMMDRDSRICSWSRRVLTCHAARIQQKKQLAGIKYGLPAIRRWSHLLTVDPWRNWASPQINGKGCDRKLGLNITVPYEMPVSLLAPLSSIAIPSKTYRLLFPFGHIQSCCSLALKYAPFSLCDSSICLLRIFPPSHPTSFSCNISLSQASDLIVCVRMQIYPPLWLPIHSFSIFGLFWTISTLLGASENISHSHTR